ncbi:MAG: tetratricopeptide repeat protein [Methylocella sp.]
MVEESAGRLLSDGGERPSALFNSRGDFLYFVPGAPTGHRTPEPNLVIGFIDSGTTSRHPQLDGLVIEEKTFVEGPVEDELGHGTWTMLVSLSVEPGRPVGFYSAKVTRNGSDLRPKIVNAAFDWLVSKGVKVINMSLGFDRLTPEVEALCGRIRLNPSVMVIAAAGNSGPEVKVYPAACGSNNVLSVGELRGGRPTSTSGQGQVYSEPPRFIVRWAFLLEQGREAWRAGRQDEARDLWLKSLNDTDNSGALVELGLFEAHSGHWKEARPYIARAAEMAPDNAEILQTMGAVFFATGEDDKAIEWYNRALAIDPKNVRALANLARALAVNGDRRGASEILDRVRTIKPDYPHIPEIQSLISSPPGTRP